MPKNADSFAVGPRTMALASAKVIGKDIGMVDGIGLPFIAILFAVMVGSWRLTLLPFVKIFCLLKLEVNDFSNFYFLLLFFKFCDNHFLKDSELFSEKFQETRESRRS